MHWFFSNLCLFGCVSFHVLSLFVYRFHCLSHALSRSLDLSLDLSAFLSLRLHLSPALALSLSHFLSRSGSHSFSCLFSFRSLSLSLSFSLLLVLNVYVRMCKSVFLFVFVCACVNTYFIFCDVLSSRSPAAVSPLCLATEGGVEKEGKEDGEARRPGQDGDDDDEPEEEEDLELDDYENAGISPEDLHQTTASQRDTIWAGGIGGLQPSTAARHGPQC